MKKKFAMKRVACAVALSALSGSAMAANWLMLQGTEPEAAVGPAKVWGFIQAEYQKDYSESAAGVYIPPKLIGPNLTSQSQFNIRRARLGVRGTGMPIDPSVNYFLMAEFGNNGITAPEGGGAYVTDASVTLNKIPGARVRLGTFKIPGPEELLQGIGTLDYINFTWVANQLMLERFPNRNFTGDVTQANNGGSLSGFQDAFGAARDTGVQVFDSFNVAGWDLSYAFMYSNGNGMNMGDIDDNKDTNVYVSFEKPLGGTGPKAQGLKIFAWSQSGKRQLDNTADATYNPVEYDRKRTGFGVKYLKMPFRVGFEYMSGDGMIFVGPDKPSFDMNQAAPPGNGENGKANGYYLDFGYYLNNRWQFDVRYDVYNRLTDDTPFPGGANIGKNFEVQFKKTTVGFNYHLNKKSRITVDYEMSSGNSPDWGTGAGPNANLDGIGNRLAMQVTHIF